MLIVQDIADGMVLSGVFELDVLNIRLRERTLVRGSVRPDANLLPKNQPSVGSPRQARKNRDRGTDAGTAEARDR
jgi:hypothetical protein